MSLAEARELLVPGLRAQAVVARPQAKAKASGASTGKKRKQKRSEPEPDDGPPLRWGAKKIRSGLVSYDSPVNDSAFLAPLMAALEV